MTRPEAVVFDLGKVLVDFDYSIAARRISAAGKIPADEVQKFIDHSALLFQFETGQIDREQFFEQVRATTAFRGTIDDFSRIFADIFAPIEPMTQLHAQLREQNVPTFIFSNTNELAVGHIKKNFPFFSHFDGYIYSFEHGSMKPNPKLYEVVEQQTGLRSSAILYLDDRLENVAAGAARGWQTVLHETPEKSRAAVTAVGLLAQHAH